MNYLGTALPPVLGNLFSQPASLDSIQPNFHQKETDPNQTQSSFQKCMSINQPWVLNTCKKQDSIYFSNLNSVTSVVNQDDYCLFARRQMGHHYISKVTIQSSRPSIISKFHLHFKLCPFSDVSVVVSSFSYCGRSLNWKLKTFGSLQKKLRTFGLICAECKTAAENFNFKSSCMIFIQ